MTAPAVQSVARGSNATNSTTHSVGMPSSVAAGDLLIVLFATDGNPTHSANNTLAQSFTNFFTGNNGSNVKLSAWYKIADGSEGGQTATFSTSAREQSAFQVYRISGASTTVAPFAAPPATGTNTAPNPAACSPPWGEDETLWLPVFAADAETADGAGYAYPTNYSANGIYDEANSTNGCGLGSSYRSNEAASEDVGAWTIGASEQWVATTIAIPPIGAALIGPQPRGSGTTATGSSSASVAKPSGVVEGDLLLACLVLYGTNPAVVINPPSGWTQIRAAFDDWVRIACFYKVAGASEPTSYSWSYTGAGTDLGVACIAFQRDTFDPDNPIDASHSGATGTSGPGEGASITTSEDNSRLLLFATVTNSPPNSTPAGMSSLLTTSFNSVVWEELRTSAGATGDRTFTASSYGHWAAIMLAINPAPFVEPPAPAGFFHAQLID